MNAWSQQRPNNPRRWKKKNLEILFVIILLWQLSGRSTTFFLRTRAADTIIASGIKVNDFICNATNLKAKHWLSSLTRRSQFFLLLLKYIQLTWTYAAIRCSLVQAQYKRITCVKILEWLKCQRSPYLYVIFFFFFWLVGGDIKCRYFFVHLYCIVLCVPLLLIRGSLFVSYSVVIDW